MKIVVTIIGQDRVGIVAKVSTALAECNINVMEINQNITRGLFNMVMVADMEGATIQLKDLQQKLSELGQSMGLEIKAQHEDIFNVMHRI
ncbi:MAG: ACT domain-containing protein [Alphaproteobacteria bacterium]|nr:ACT domain-containing protein [Alphaproteobacteria bacterium]